MRHRKKGRRLGRSASHRKAMMRNMASSLFLTERDSEFDDNAPKLKGRIVTTVPKAKELRPIVERCITIAKRSLQHSEAAQQYAPDAERGTDDWKSWRNSEQYLQWNAAIAPAVAARRRVLQLLGDRQAVSIVFEEIAPRFVDRPGGYTRILRLAEPRLGDAGQQAILELVGVHDRVAARAQKPAFDDSDVQTDQLEAEADEQSEPFKDEVASQEQGSAEESRDQVTEADAKNQPGDTEKS